MPRNVKAIKRCVTFRCGLTCLVLYCFVYFKLSQFAREGYDQTKKKLPSISVNVLDNNAGYANKLMVIGSQFAAFKDFGIAVSYYYIQLADLKDIFDVNALADGFHDVEDVNRSIYESVELSDDDFRFRREAVLSNYSRGCVVTFPRYVFDVKGMYRRRKDLVRMFKIKESHLNEAKRRLKEVKAKRCRGVRNCVYIGVHIRAGDYKKHLRRTYGYEDVLSPNSSYLKRAMDYFVSIYPEKNAVFYVLCVETDHAKNFMLKSGLLDVTKYKVEWPGSTIAGVDFALISLADSVITTYGSYGFMASVFYCQKCKAILSPKGYDDTFENLYIRQANIPNLIYI